MVVFFCFVALLFGLGWFGSVLFCLFVLFLVFFRSAFFWFSLWVVLPFYLSCCCCFACFCFFLVDGWVRFCFRSRTPAYLVCVLLFGGFRAVVVLSRGRVMETVEHEHSRKWLGRLPKNTIIGEIGGDSVPGVF